MPNTVPLLNEKKTGFFSFTDQAEKSPDSGYCLTSLIILQIKAPFQPLLNLS